jgi:hypothetical protein
MTKEEYVPFEEFVLRPATLFERLFGREKLQHGMEAAEPHYAARVWSCCKKFAENPQIRTLSGHDLHDISFSVSLMFALEGLQSRERLPRGYVKQLWSDKSGFLHRAYEAEMAAYFWQKGTARLSWASPISSCRWVGVAIS